MGFCLLRKKVNSRYTIRQNVKTYRYKPSSLDSPSLKGREGGRREKERKEGERRGEERGGEGRRERESAL